MLIYQINQNRNQAKQSTKKEKKGHRQLRVAVSQQPARGKEMAQKNEEKQQTNTKKY